MGTTNLGEMFSPARSGSVHIFTSASRAELAWREAIPGSPAFNASSRSRHSSARTSPTMMREGRIRRLSLTRSRSRISPVPSSPCCRVCRATQSGWPKRSSKTSSTEITRSPPGDRRREAVERRGLAGLRAPGDQDVEPDGHRRLEEPRGLLGEAVQPHQIGQPGRADDELPDVHRRETAGYPLEHDMEPVTVGQHGVDERLGDVDPTTAGLEHPLDQLLDLRRAQDRRGQLVPAGAGDEDAAGVVDPDLLDRRVVEVALQRPEARDPRDELLDHVVRVGHRRDDAGEAALVVVGDHPRGQGPDLGGVALRVDPVAPHGRAQLRVELLDHVTVRIHVGQTHGPPSPFRRRPRGRVRPFRAILTPGPTAREPRGLRPGDNLGPGDGWVGCGDHRARRSGPPADASEPVGRERGGSRGGAR